MLKRKKNNKRYSEIFQRKGGGGRIRKENVLNDMKTRLS